MVILYKSFLINHALFINHGHTLPLFINRDRHMVIRWQVLSMSTCYRKWLALRTTVLIVFIRCSNNNCSSAVLNAFCEGQQSFGTRLWWRKRVGMEGRNLLEANKRVIAGSSTHNVWVERMWRDITRCVSSSFIKVFSQLETDGVLDSTNELDIFCLHCIFLPRVNKALTDFQGSWTCHSLSSEGGKSPLRQGLCAIVADDNEAESSSTDSNTVPLQTSSVETPTNKFLPCTQLLVGLSLINPLAPSSDFGRQNLLYCQCIDIVSHHLQNVCSYCKCSLVVCLCLSTMWYLFQ